MFGIAKEKLPSPVQLSRPTKISAPMPAASRPGRSTTLIVVPARPAASMSRKAPVIGRAEQGRDGREAAGARDHPDRGLGCVLLHQPHREHAEAAADGDQGRLRPEDGSQAQGRQRGHDDAGQVPRVGRPAGLEALSRLVAGGAVQVLQGQARRSDRSAAAGAPATRRRGPETQILGKADEHEVLGLAHEREEEVGDAATGTPTTAARTSSPT